MERETKALVAAAPAAAAVLTVLGAVAEAKQLPGDLERAVQVPCQDSLTDGTQEPPDEGSAPRVVRGKGTPLTGVASMRPATGRATPAKTA